MAKIDGTQGNDTLEGTPTADTIRARAGDDDLSGLDGDDTLNGGSGADELEGGLGSDRLSGGKDDDVLEGDEDDDVLQGAAGADRLDGGEGEDVLRGGAGTDTADGRQGDDVLDGGPGDDILRGGNENDLIRGAAGNDTILGGSGDDLMGGGTGADSIAGATGNDVLDGGDGADDLDGAAGNDAFQGGEGNDSINGAEGTDTAVFQDLFSRYTIDGQGADVHVSDDEPDMPADGDDEGTDTLASVEVLVFADRTTNGDGSNSFPEVGDDKTLSVAQDSPPVVIGIEEPSDPDDDDLRVQILELPDPELGIILDRNGDPVLVGDQPDVLELVRFEFEPAEGVFGQAGRFVYRVDDFNGAVVTQTITIEILEPDPGVIELSALTGNNGFVVEGLLEDDQLGSCVGGGRDVDGDGLDDLVVGARTASGAPQTGKAFILYGDETFVARRDAGLGQDTQIHGRGERDRLGIACALTDDADGDDAADVLLGARGLGSEPDLPAGEAFFLRGELEPQGFLDLSDLGDSQGFRVEGDNAEDFAGAAVADAGDFNDDGLSDLLIGAFGVDAVNAEERGEVYLLFGQNDLSQDGLNLSTIDEDLGLRLLGAARRDALGSAVSGAGDVNGDGIDDIIVGTQYADPDGTRSGQSFVVFGTAQESDDGVLSLADLDGDNGFTIDGYNASEDGPEMRSGTDVAGAGDVNGDGFDDLIVGAPGISDFGDSMGGAFVVYGGPDVGQTGSVNLEGLSPEQGFIIRGVSSLDLAGTSVAGAGDFNDDGFDDVVLGAPAAEPHGAGSGAAYVVFGSAAGPEGGQVELFTLDGSDGIALQGPEKAGAGAQVAGAGDVNGDGFDDVIVGASTASPEGKPFAGEVYVVFGRESEPAELANVAALTPASASTAVSMLPALLALSVTAAWTIAAARRLRR